MMSTCASCKTPTDLAISDVMTEEQFAEYAKLFNNDIPLVGTCGRDMCNLRILNKLSGGK